MPEPTKKRPKTSDEQEYTNEEQRKIYEIQEGMKVLEAIKDPETLVEQLELDDERLDCLAAFLKLPLRDGFLHESRNSYEMQFRGICCQIAMIIDGLRKCWIAYRKGADSVKRIISVLEEALPQTISFLEQFPKADLLLNNFMFDGSTLYDEPENSDDCDTTVESVESDIQKCLTWFQIFGSLKQEKPENRTFPTFMRSFLYSDLLSEFDDKKIYSMYELFQTLNQENQPVDRTFTTFLKYVMCMSNVTFDECCDDILAIDCSESRRHTASIRHVLFHAVIAELKYVKEGHRERENATGKTICGVYLDHVIAHAKRQLKAHSEALLLRPSEKCEQSSQLAMFEAINPKSIANYFRPKLYGLDRNIRNCIATPSRIKFLGTTHSETYRSINFCTDGRVGFIFFQYRIYFFIGNFVPNDFFLKYFSKRHVGFGYYGSGWKRREFKGSFFLRHGAAERVIENASSPNPLKIEGSNDTVYREDHNDNLHRNFFYKEENEECFESMMKVSVLDSALFGYPSILMANGDDNMVWIGGDGRIKGYDVVAGLDKTSTTSQDTNDDSGNNEEEPSPLLKYVLDYTKDAQGEGLLSEAELVEKQKAFDKKYPEEYSFRDSDWLLQTNNTIHYLKGCVVKSWSLDTIQQHDGSLTMMDIHMEDEDFKKNFPDTSKVYDGRKWVWMGFGDEDSEAEASPGVAHTSQIFLEDFGRPWSCGYLPDNSGFVFVYGAGQSETFSESSFSLYDAEFRKFGCLVGHLDYDDANVVKRPYFDNGNEIVTSVRNCVKIWDLRTLKPTITIQMKNHGGCSNALPVSTANGAQYLFTSSFGRQGTSVWDLRMKRVLYKIPATGDLSWDKKSMVLTASGLGEETQGTMWDFSVPPKQEEDKYVKYHIADYWKCVRSQRL